jgi:MFS family permease
MSAAPLDHSPWRFTFVQLLVCLIAIIGFAFDIYELLMLPLILRPALMEFIHAPPNSPEFIEQFAFWRGILFFVPAFAGGIFGLLGGYLTDRWGRRRVLTGSILLYAVSAFAAGYSTSIYMLLFFRCTTFIGVCVEFVAAVAWLAELFPNHTQREVVLGTTQAFSSVGGLMVAIANGIAVAWAVGKPAPLLFGLTLPAVALPAIVLPEWLAELLGGTIQNPHAAWRYTLMSGLIPAIPLILIRPFLPESPAWKAKKDAGTLKRPSLAELFAPRLRRTTVVTTILFACSYGVAFGAIQQIPQIVPGLPQVQEMTAAKKTLPEKRQVEQAVAANVTKWQEFGGLFGRVALAVLATLIVSRRGLLRLFQIPGLIITPLVFAFVAVRDLELLNYGIFIVGALTVGQFSFWGNYLPRVYPIHLRGTGESFAANIGGRMIGTSFAFVTSQLATMPFIPGASDPTKMAYAAAAVALFVYLVATVVCFWLPEPGTGEVTD